MSWIARAGTVAVVAGIVGVGVAGPAFAGTGTSGRQVRMWAQMTLWSLSVVANANGLRRCSSPRIAAPATDVAQAALARRGR